MAIFSREQYRGTLTTDLFADEETTYYDNVDQFLALQHRAAEALAEERHKTATWVEVLHVYSVPWWQFRDASEHEPSGVVVNLHPSGAVEVREGLARHDVAETAIRATPVSPLAPRAARERPVFGAELVRYAACQRSAAVQAALLADPRKAKEAAVALSLVDYRRTAGVRLVLHECHSTPAAEQMQRAHQSIRETTEHAISRLGFAASLDETDRKSAPCRLFDGPEAFAVLAAVRQLADEDLDRLLALLPILCFGQDRTDAVDDGDSLFNRIAADLGLRMRLWWKPDATFLALLTREQLLRIAHESGATAYLRGMNGWTKRRLVDELAAYFAERIDPQKEAHRPAAEWLPGLLCIPARKCVVREQT
jgi:ParB family chromosome partitioning protein